MLTRITSKIPRIVYYSVKRFASLFLFIFIGALIGYLIIMMAEYSVKTFGTPLPVFALVAAGLVGSISYMFAKLDVENEAREQEKVLRELQKD